jgi:hypothetical protein
MRIRKTSKPTLDALHAVAKALKPGGKIYIWLYHPEPGLKFWLQLRLRSVIAPLLGPIKRAFVHVCQAMARQYLRTLLGVNNAFDRLNWKERTVDLSRGAITIFGLLGFVPLLGFHLWISTSFKNALARGTIAGDQAIIIGDGEALSVSGKRIWTHARLLRTCRDRRADHHGPQSRGCRVRYHAAA